MRHYLSPLIVAALLLVGCLPSVQADQRSENDQLVSLSLCADSYLIAMDVPDRLAGLSWQAGTPLSTWPKDKPVPPRFWASREISAVLPSRPVTGPGGAIGLHADEVNLVWGEDFDTVKSNLRLIAMDTGLPVDDLLDAIDALDALPRPERPPLILYLSRSGASAGPGTFIDAVIRKAGGENINTAPGWHTPSLEQILTYKPDIILTSFFGSDYSGMTDRAVRHQALKDYIASTPRIDIPGKLWPCAGPGLIDATQRLNVAIRTIDETRDASGSPS